MNINNPLKRRGGGKAFIVFIINVIVFIFGIYVLENIVFYTKVKPMYSNLDLKFRFSKFYPHSPWGMDTAKCYGCNNSNSNESILVIGCSYAYGTNLKDEQKISYKLNKALNMPVYNYAIPGGGLSYTYKLLENGYIAENVKIPPKYVLYFWYDDHIRRMYEDVSWQDKAQDYIFYKNINGRLKQKRLSIFEDLYVINFIKHQYFELHYKYKNNFLVKYIDSRIDNLLELYLSSIVKEIKDLYPNTKFIIIKFSNFEKENILSKYDQFDLYKETGINLCNKDINPEYIVDYGHHPSELYWDIMLPIIIKKLENSGN